MLGPVRNWFDGAGWFVGLAVALFAYALVALLGWWQSPGTDTLDHVVAASLIGVPAAGGVVLLVIGGTRNYRWMRRKLKRAREFQL